MFLWKAILVVKFHHNSNPSEVDPLAFHCLVLVSYLTVNYRKPELLNRVPYRPVRILHQNKFSFTSSELKGWSFHQETGLCPLLWKMNHTWRHYFSQYPVAEIVKEKQKTLKWKENRALMVGCAVPKFWYQEKCTDCISDGKRTNFETGQVFASVICTWCFW